MEAETIHLLLVEDNPADARAVRERLAEVPNRPFRLECADRLASGEERLSRGGVDVLLLDLGLPDSYGLATFTALHVRHPTVPVVVLSGAADEELGIKAVQAGAQDYLVKGTETSQVLTRALCYAIERKRAEEQIRRLNADLERRVLERTAQLEQANREMESFVYAIAHDLRAPLRAMNGFAQMLIEDYTPHLPPEVQRRLQVISERAVHMSKLIEGLLKLSGIGRQSLEKAPIAPGELVHDAIEELQSEQAGRRVEITVGDLPPCEADRVLLEQVFVNLLSNALKYTRKREIAKIEVNAVTRNGECIYCVRDNGTGFDMRHHDKLFGVFQRLRQPDEFEGIGIGLSIVQRIIQRHGGRVWAEAAVDRGATFYFTV